MFLYWNISNIHYVYVYLYVYTDVIINNTIITIWIFITIFIIISLSAVWTFLCTKQNNTNANVMFAHSCCYACFKPDDTYWVGLQSPSKSERAALWTTRSETGLNWIHTRSALSCLHFNFSVFLLHLGGREDSPIRLLMMQHQPWPAQVN